MKFAIIGNSFQAEKLIYTEKLLKILSSKGATIIIYRDFYNSIKHSIGINIEPDSLFNNEDFTADMVISIGGDGTFLYAARLVGDKNIPIIGLNTGRLGFLADISPDEIDQTINEIMNNEYDIESRSLLQLCCNNSNIKHRFALNDIAILKRDDASMITIQTKINDSYLATYQSDGLIVATPTGSTAYSLSSGGPIIEPNSESFVITPIAPHSLNVRPFVIKDNNSVNLKIESRNHSYLVSIDGHSYTCNEETELTIRKAPYTIRLVKRKNLHFYDTLRNKLMWGVDKR